MPIKKYYTVYKRKSILGGMISWSVKVKSESYGKDLEINTAEEYDKILLNDKTIWTKN